VAARDVDIWGWGHLVDIWGWGHLLLPPPQESHHVQSNLAKNARCAMEKVVIVVLVVLSQVPCITSAHVRVVQEKGLLVSRSNAQYVKEKVGRGV